MRWESATTPTADFLTRMLSREGLSPEPVEFAAQSQSMEMKYEQAVVYVVATGKIQYAFPGYGAIDLAPGDILEINPGVLHDITVTGNQSASVLKALRHASA